MRDMKMSQDIIAMLENRIEKLEREIYYKSAGTRAPKYDIAPKWRAYSKELRHHTYAKDVDALSHFYNKELGLPVLKYWRRGDDKGTMLSLGGNVLEIFGQDEEKSEYHGKTSISSRVPNVVAYYKKLSRKNVRGLSKLRENSWGDTSFDVIDPEGNRITFFTPKDVISYYSTGKK